VKTKKNNKRIKHNNIKQWLIEYNHNDWDWILLSLTLPNFLRSTAAILNVTESSTTVLTRYLTSYKHKTVSTHK